MIRVLHVSGFNIVADWCSINKYCYSKVISKVVGQKSVIKAMKYIEVLYNINAQPLEIRSF